MSYILTEIEALTIKDTLRDHGHRNISQASTAMHDTHFYKSRGSGYLPLKLALERVHGVTDRLASALLWICNYDPRIRFLTKILLEQEIIWSVRRENQVDLEFISR